MTRQKKEIIRRIEEIENFISIDQELGCGFSPAGAYDSAYEQISELEKQLAALCHYNSVEDMYFDERGFAKDTEEPLPFI